MNMEATSQAYPGILSRTKAAITDYLLIMVMMLIFSYFFELLEIVSSTPKIVAFLFIFFLYDPLLSATVGGTVGHQLMGLHISKVTDESKNISFPFAVIRFALKVALGWISLLLILSDNKGRAIHDMAVGSVVVYRK